MYGDSLLVAKTSVTIKKLKSKKKYYFRVKAYKKYGSRKVLSKKWSNVKRVKKKKDSMRKIMFCLKNNC